MKYSHLMKIKEMMHKAATSLTDEDALEAVELFPLWVVDKWYEANERIRYGEKLYRCVIAHTSQASWTPDITPALWISVSVEEWPEWVQPTGAQDAYRIGDKVTYIGQRWICSLDYNVYPPDVTGWELVE